MSEARRHSVSGAAGGTSFANRRRGEVEAVIGGERRILCLTLGALAELESAFAAEDLRALAARFSTGRLKAGDLIRLLGAGLRGGGNPIPDEDVAMADIEGGIAGAAAIAAALLSATFEGPQGLGEAQPGEAGGKEQEHEQEQEHEHGLGLRRGHGRGRGLGAAPLLPEGHATGGPAQFPWREALHLGFHGLRLSSAAFWSLTPYELFAMAGGLGAGGAAGSLPPGRAVLQALMARFPDEEPMGEPHA